MIALEPGQQWLSQFRLLQELVVKSDRRPNIWLAEKYDSGNKVVLKFLNASSPSPLLVRRLADWRATRIAQFMPLLGVHTSGDQIALELPFVADDSAYLRGASYTQWSVWLRKVIETLHTLHGDSFVHGDIKLGNIRRDTHGRPVLSDPWLPGDGKSLYTASPERLKGGPISIHDDLYALGALIHELSTGYPPRYPGLASGNPPKPRFEMPSEVTAVMNALLQTAPARRPALAVVMSILAPLNTTRPQDAEAKAPAAATSPPRAVVAAPASATQVATPPVAVVAAQIAAESIPVPTPAVPTPVAADLTPLISPPLEIQSPVDEPFQPVALQVGSPTWARPSMPSGIATNSPSPFQSRASVWRWPLLLVLLAAAIAAFVWLPAEVRQSAVERVTAMAARTGLVPASPPPATAPSQLRELAEQKLAAEQARDNAAQLETNLLANGAGARVIASFVAGTDANKQGLAAFAQRNFEAAGADFKLAIKSFDATRQALPQMHAQALAAGDAALAQCLRERALSEYRYALALAPQEARAAEGIARAQVCERVFAHVAAGAKAEQNGDTDTAKNEYQAAVSLDPKSSTAQTALSALTGQVDDTRFSRQLAAALENLRKHRYSAAATAIAAAGKLRPGNPDVRRLSEQLGEVHSIERLQALKAEAAEDERAEQWSEALDAYHAMLAVDGTLVIAMQGAQRSADRMKLDVELAGYINDPGRLSADEVRNAAVAALSRSQVLSTRGPRIVSQLSRIKVLLSQFDSLVRVALRSDGLTNITLYRVAGLGKFTQRALSLKPGKYTFVGSRLGYRDVRRELVVEPGKESAGLEISCEEQI